MKKKTFKVIKKIRSNILNLTYKAKSSHIGSSLSIVEILVSLYFGVLKKTDKFILSKGHAALALYCVLFEKKIISKRNLDSYGSNGTILMNHASHKVRGIEFSTGSLGHGLPVAVGKAIKFKSINKKYKVFVLISDGELNEGTTWESLLFASHHKLDNLNIIIDYNKIQSLDFVNNVLGVEPLRKKLESFGCHVEITDGHSVLNIQKKLKKLSKNKPKILIANTVKGKGISFMENNNLWHYKNPNKNQLIRALKEVNLK